MKTTYGLPQTRSLTAYYYGVAAGSVSIPAKHVRIDGGFAVPLLTGWFSDDHKITSAFVVANDVTAELFQTTFYVICSQFNALQPPSNPNNCELLVFRKAAFSGTLVNLRPSDIRDMPAIVKW